MAATEIPSPRLLWGLYDHQAKRRFGQHFLTDETILDQIAGLLSIPEGASVLEIGPGYGGLSTTMLRRGYALRAVELDREAAGFLRQNLEPFGIDLQEGDATQMPIEQMLPPDKAPWFVVANLPYNVATVILFRLLEQQQSTIENMALMFQREVAQRLVAQAGEDAYGALSLSCQLWADCDLAMRLPPGAFTPAPKVHSAIVRLRPIPGSRIPDDDLRDRFLRLVKSSFQKRRKTLPNGFKSLGLDKNAVRDLLEELDLNPMIRPERLSFDGFLDIAKVWQSEPERLESA